MHKTAAGERAKTQKEAAATMRAAMVTAQNPSILSS
jgi:hypothetical protein